MAQQRVRRRLAAILAADVVGYSRMMGFDETGTLAALKDFRTSVFEPMIREYHGRIVKLMGDGALVEFGSVVDAVECGVGIQRSIAARTEGTNDTRVIQLRIGINLGDIIIEGRDTYGDGVNIASRLESIADPAGICISAHVFEQVKGKVEVGFEDLGNKRFKNIADPVRAYRVILPRDGRPAAIAATQTDRPSIAVLPLDSMSDDPEQQHFSDGVSEDLTTALSRFDWLFVAARNAAFAYKGQSIDVKQVGRELGVRYVMEGSVRRIGANVRVNAQVINTETLGHVWADLFDRKMDDAFAVQDDVVARIASTVAPEIIQAEIAQAKLRRPEEMTARDHYFRAIECYHSMTQDRVEQAIRYLEAARELDPDFAAAYALRALCEGHAAARGWHRPAKSAYALAHQLAELAVRLSPTSPETNEAYAFILLLTGKPGKAVTVAQRSVELNPYYARAYAVLGHALVHSGDLEGGLAACEKAQRSNPRDPRGSWLLDALGHAYFFMGDYEKAIEVSNRAIYQDPSLFGALVTLACANARLGRKEEAKRAVDQLLHDIPRYSLRAVRKNPMFADPKFAQKLIDSLALAGLPEE
jgi:adenylate cyclase